MKKIFKGVVGVLGGGGGAKGPSKGEAAAAERAAAEANRKAQEVAQALQQNFQQNFQADLSTDNIAQIAPGGEAAMSGDDDFTPQRKRNRVGGLSTQLGIGGDTWL